MITPDRIAAVLVGEGSLAAAIAHHDTPLRGLTIGKVDPSRSASDVVADPRYPAVVIDCDVEGRGELVVRALQGGKLVVSSFPPALDASRLEEIGGLLEHGGKLIVFQDLAAYSTCRDALAALRDGHVGQLQSLYIAYRLPRSESNQVPILNEVGWAVVDLLVEIAGAMPSRVFASGGTLFGAPGVADTATMILRFPNDFVATIEVSRCLPAAPSNSSTVDVEVEVIGAAGAIRLEPKGGRSHVSTEAGRFERAWSDERVLPLMTHVLAVAQGTAKADPRLGRAEQAIAIMAAIEESLSTASAVALAPR